MCDKNETEIQKKHKCSKLTEVLRIYRRKILPHNLKKKMTYDFKITKMVETEDETWRKVPIYI